MRDAGSDQDRPFIAYRRGRWGLKIVPRGAAGWWLFFLWMLPLVPVTAAYVWAISRVPEGRELTALIVGYIVALTLWAVIMTRWMLKRSEQVEIETLLALKREKDAQERLR
jgi:uncharacterized membrane protein